MQSYVLVDTRDPFESGNGRDRYELAKALADVGDDVSVFLAENAVLATRRGSAVASDLEAMASRSRVLVDAFALRERAIVGDEMVTGVETVEIDALVDELMTEGRKALWL